MSGKLHLTTEDFSELPKMGLDQTGTMTLKFKITGANKYASSENSPYDKDSISYDMDYQIVEIKPDKMGLTDSIESAMRQQEEIPIVRVATAPFPG